MALPSPSRATVAWRIKPLVWLLALAPAAWLLWGMWRALEGDVSVLGADPAETLVHGSGEMALRALLATLLLGTLRDLCGLGWVVQLRRLFGLFAFFWASAHLLAYAGLELEGDLGRLGADFLERPYILAGAIALGAMIPLALTSTRGWRRRLGRRWSQLHRLIWLAALSACVHLIWQVRADLGEALVYVGLFALVAGQRSWSKLRPDQRSEGAGTGPGRGRKTGASRPSLDLGQDAPSARQENLRESVVRRRGWCIVRVPRRTDPKPAGPSRPRTSLP